MLMAIVIGVVTFVVIIALGMGIGHAVSSPQTRALTQMISAHRFGDKLAQAQSVGGVFSAYGLDASGTRQASKAEIAERRAKLLTDAAQFDRRYGRFHWGVMATEILKAEMGTYLDGQ